MSRIGKALRFEVLTRDGYRCRYCGAGASTATLHMDHVVPLSAGGRDDVANLVTACIDCNYGKSDRKIIGIPEGFALTPDKRPARVAKMRKALAAKKAPADDYHELDCYEIDSLDEYDDDSQLALVWCETHNKYEWHYIHLDLVKYGGSLTVRRKAVFS